ncbi:XRE family transcriptional regulator [Actinokineospora sp. NBRC 105648]|uniref:XRE family transcriptional regulator n=1 Tax=Actinokineospora sp. NBRC 105648 TaxID=3032206 RepID=UPI0024A054B1|nr:XRE family transcriptional regulator [Actinokineospora sp. NBRC 105648]GLZ40071.1 hypothetical protein Acsp05_36950 [Actinokineospora sp. NBRC 105648]
MPAPTDKGTTRDLARILRTGSFAEALDAAITVRGLTLDRLRYHLAGRGIDVSVATLSYWRRDRRRPERAESLRAVEALEVLLGLPRSSLITLLGPPRPRGRWMNRTDAIDPLAGAGADLLTRFEDPDEGRYGLISAHDVFTVRADRAERGVRSRVVLRAEQGRVTRFLAKYRSDDPEFPPELIDVRFCRTGRVLSDDRTGLIVAELLLDRPLRTGEHAVVEYEISGRPGPPVEFYYRQFTEPIAEYSQQVQFEGTPPVECHGFRRDDLEQPEQATDPLPVGPSRASCLVGVNLSPGVVGTRWRW